MQKQYYANRSQRSCNNCRHDLRGHLQELNKAQDAETPRDGESGAADGGGASSAPYQDETGIDHASDQAVIFSHAYTHRIGASSRPKQRVSDQGVLVGVLCADQHVARSHARGTH
jgi:hypothetical protein